MKKCKKEGTATLCERLGGSDEMASIGNDAVDQHLKSPAVDVHTRMKTRIVFTMMITMGLLFGCEDFVVNPELRSAGEPGLQNRGNSGDNDAFIMGADATFSETAVLKFSDLSAVGTSRLLRNDNGISFSIKTTQLEAGTALTVWMVIFNKPEKCSNGMCGADDIFDAGARAAVMADVVFSGSGRVVQHSGEANFAGQRNTGDNSESIIPLLFGGPAFGLMDAREAEIHFVVRSHGPLVPGLIQEQISTFNGGCGGLPPELGAPGPNDCKDLQFAVHLPD